jgi:hypothetical protein
LVVNTLDRSSRSMADGAKLVADAKLEAWRIAGLDGTDSDTVSQLTAHARLLVAEEERELISKRTKQGLIRARQEGKRFGKPSTIDRKTVHASSSCATKALAARPSLRLWTSRACPHPRVAHGATAPSAECLSVKASTVLSRRVQAWTTLRCMTLRRRTVGTVQRTRADGCHDP